MTLRHVVAKSSGGGPGDKQARAGAFPGTISAQKGFFGEVPACASPEPVEEGGANMGLEEAAEVAKVRAWAQRLRGKCTWDRREQICARRRMCSGAECCSGRGCAGGGGGGGKHSGAGVHTAGAPALLPSQ